MSLWADYHKERLGWSVIETDGGFIAYRLNPPDCSIEDFYVRPEHRTGRLALRLAEEVSRRAEAAGAKRLWAKVVIGTTGAERALRMNLNWGFKLAATAGNDIILVKEIGGSGGR